MRLSPKVSRCFPFLPLPKLPSANTTHRSAAMEVRVPTPVLAGESPACG